MERWSEESCDDSLMVLRETSTKSAGFRRWLGESRSNEVDEVSGDERDCRPLDVVSMLPSSFSRFFYRLSAPIRRRRRLRVGCSTLGTELDGRIDANGLFKGPFELEIQRRRVG